MENKGVVFLRKSFIPVPINISNNSVSYMMADGSTVVYFKQTQV